MPQELFLFSDTVAANLRVGAPDATEAELWHALPWRPPTTSSPRSRTVSTRSRSAIAASTLSGGQRQRLTLARAFAAAPADLVLDDATSALDAVTERTILDGLRAPVGAGGSRSRC